MADPRFRVLGSARAIRFLQWQLERVVNLPPSDWPGKHRLTFERMESLYEALTTAEIHRIEVSRIEASTLLAFIPMLMQGREEYDYESLYFTGVESDHPRQELVWEQEQAKTRYPGSLDALIPRLEIVAGLRTSLPGQVTSRMPLTLKSAGLQPA
jgi:hypothetical protein